jgi:adenylyl cyclase-associated protein
MQGQLDFVLTIVDMSGKCKKPAPEVRTSMMQPFMRGARARGAPIGRAAVLPGRCTCCISSREGRGLARAPPSTFSSPQTRIRIPSPLPPLFPSSQFAAERMKALGEIRKTLDSLCGHKVALPFPDLAKGCMEGIPAFGWPLSPMSPGDMIMNGVESSEFYHNKLRKWGKDNNKPEFGAFANAFRDVLKAMAEWTKDNAKMGLAWNAKTGVDVSAYKPIGGAAAPAAAAPAAAAPAPAPAAAAPAPAPAAAAPAPAPAAPAAAAPAAAPKPPALNALFAQISSIDQSAGRTEGLRHVTKDMKASANKDAPAPVVAAAPKPAAAAAPKAGGIKMGAPKVALQGMRWEVEYVTKESQNGQILSIADANIKQDIYIYGCKDVAIDISCKVKGVRIDQCQNVTILLSAALSGVEIVNSRRMKIQAREKLPSVAIDKTDGILVGLAWAARDAVITSSKSSEMNVTFPVSEAADADWVEQPVPEQFVSHVTKEGKVVTTVSELYSS